MTNLRTRTYLQAGNTIVITPSTPLCSISISDGGKSLKSYDGNQDGVAAAGSDFQVRFTVGAAGYYLTTVGVDSAAWPNFDCLVSVEGTH